MNLFLLHPWSVTPRKAIEIQEELRKRLVIKPLTTSPQKIGAGDVAYSRTDNKLYAAFLLFSYPDLSLLEKAATQGRAFFPYVPGLLTFREAPILLKAFAKLESRPDLILLDGQGIAHPRSMGIAAHLGLLLDIPSIGCAKSRLIGGYEEPGREQGSVAPLVEGGRIVGMVVRTRAGVKPVYVSPGHKIDLKNSVKTVLSLCRGYRVPEPLRQAHILVNQLRAENR